MEKYIRKLTKSSRYSYYLIIPGKIVEKYGWRERQKMVLKDNGNGKVEISDWRKR